MSVATNVVFLWAGANASIPTGWTRDTDLDGKFVLGATAGNDGGDTGGTATHTHTVDAHNHTGNAHLHTFSGAAAPENINATGFGGTSAASHTHKAANSSYATATTANGAITLDGFSNEPDNLEVIFVKSDGTNEIGDDMLGFFDDTTLPTDWAIYENSKLRFLKGAVADGDGGGTNDTSLEAHVHTNTAHSHTENAHGHSNSTSTVQTGRATIGGGFGNKSNNINHYHGNIQFVNNGDTTTSTTAITMSSVDGEPTFKKLAVIQNQTGGEDTPDQIIGLWFLDKDDIPTNWARYSAMDDYFLKGADDTSEIGDTGGSDQHNHTADAHTHTGSSHNHNVGTSSINNICANGSGAGGATAVGHNHVWTVNNTTLVWQNATATINNNTSKSNYPEYITGIFIKYTKPSIVPQRTMVGVGI